MKEKNAMTESEKVIDKKAIKIERSKTLSIRWIFENNCSSSDRALPDSSMGKCLLWSKLLCLCFYAWWSVSKLYSVW